MLFFFLACTLGTQPPSKPDILLVVLDTVRADRLSAYGYQRPTSRQLEEIAKAGIQFQDASAPSSWTWPSHASLFTGEPPWVHGAHRSEKGVAIEKSDWTVSMMREDLPTLAEQLKKAGYHTESYSTNNLLDPSLGLMRGFEHAQVHKSDPETLKFSIKSLQKERKKPLFLFVNLMSAHAPYLVVDEVPWSARHKDSFDQKGNYVQWAKPYLFDALPGLYLPYYQQDGLNGEMRYTKGELSLSTDQLAVIGDLYDGELVLLDMMLRDLMRVWGSRDGIIAITSDHGEYLGEHNRIGHGADLHPPVIGVPLVLAYPGKLPAGKKREDPVSIQQLGATVLELVGLEGKGGLGKEHSLLHPRKEPILSGVWGFMEWSKLVNPHFGLRKRWVRKGKWAASVLETGEVSLYDLSSDPEMKIDRAKEEIALCKTLHTAAMKSFQQEAEYVPSKEQEAELQKKLKSLGYMEQ